MANPLAVLGSLGLGAGAMYFFDPNRGNRRRALVRDQFVHACAKSRSAADVVRRDATNRLHGLYAVSRSALHPDEPSDDVLHARVRAKIGRCVSHPSSIEVHAHDGVVTVAGPILADEVEALLDNVESVRGVQAVRSALDVHREPGNISGLQGGRPRRGEALDVMQDSWSPTTRAALGAAGVGLMAACLSKWTPTTILLGTLGFGLTARAMTNAPAQRLIRPTRELAHRNERAHAPVG
jgi:hypothetical protein